VEHLPPLAKKSDPHVINIRRFGGSDLGPGGGDGSYDGAPATTRTEGMMGTFPLRSNNRG